MKLPISDTRFSIGNLLLRCVQSETFHSQDHMMKFFVFHCLVFAFLSPLFGQPQTPFSTDSASTYLRTIAVDIGARPMGSAAERRGMEFALQKFREFGLSDAYIMFITEYPGFMGSPPTNTRSGVAVGVLRGTTSRIIVLGAHMDSADPSVPGANDDGSGSAAVIELARVLSQRKNQSTIVFALFGGEEAGLQGSRHFVENFADTNRIALMLQLDMANGSPLLFPTLDVAKHSSPEWLVRASYEEFAKLGYTGLHYPTDFFVLMAAMPGGGVGSDHEPFLEKNIPAIDFTSDARDPIHTPQDNFENFKISGLKRSGDLIYKLVERFDAGVPKEKTGSYFLYEVATFPMFVPLWGLQIIVVLSFIIAGVALINVRKRRASYEGTVRPKMPGLKLFLLMLIVQTCVWMSENIVALLKGVRFPWMADINGYFVLAFFAACIGIWLSLQLSRRLHLRQEAYPYFLRATAFLMLLILLFSFSSTKLALYPASALFMLSLAMLVRQPLLRIIFWLLSPHFMFRLFFSEAFDFISRALHSQPDITPGINTVLQLGYILFFSLWAFPFLLGFAAIAFDAHTDLFVKHFRRRLFGIIAFALFAVTIIALSIQESYSKEWLPSVRVEQDYNLDSTRGALTLEGTEYLKNMHLIFMNRDTVLRSSGTEARFEKALPIPEQPWVEVSRSLQTERGDSTRSVELLLHFHFKHQPTRIRVSYSSSRALLSNASSPYALLSTARAVSLQWGAFSDTTLIVPLSFTLAGKDSLKINEHIEVGFVEQPQNVSLTTERPFSIVPRANFMRENPIKLE